ncbi:MAG: hypothetical protein IPH48_10355 [bacterium]|nr:hypothetical protein [bacterium]
MTYRLPQVVRFNTAIRLASATVLAAFTAAGTVPASGAGTGPTAADASGFVTLAAAPSLVEGGARGALVALPRDASGGRAWVAGQAGAQASAEPGRVMIMRGRPVLLARAEAAAGQAPVTLQVAHDGNWEAEAPDHRLASPALDAALGGLPAGKAATVSQGSYVIVYDAALAAAVAPLAQWKTLKGLRVVTVGTDVTGSSTAGIKAWLQTAYDTWDNPPEYVVLLGDIGAIPTYTFQGNPTDLPYVLLDGDDFLPDAMLGRFPVENLSQAQTMVARTIGYERTPYTAEPAWFTKSLMVAGLTGSTTPPYTVAYCGRQLQAIGFSAPTAVTSPVPMPPLLGAQMIKQNIDLGASMVVYRGWAYGSGGWDPPTYTVNDIPALNNGWKLPVVMSFVCLTGDYTSSPACFGEAMVRQGTPEAPGKGAVAFIGNGEHWSHTRYNDAMAIAMFERITDDSLTDLGSLLDAGKLRFIDYFPDELDAATHGEESVEFYFHIYNLLGDPELNYWRGAPRAVTVAAPALLPAGSNEVSVAVTTTAGSVAVAGARVGVTQGGVLLGSGVTDGAGLAHVLLSPVTAGANVDVTVTGALVVPVETAVPTTTAAVYVAASGATVADGGDGVPNPGDELSVTLRMQNHGTASSGAFSVTAASVEGPALVTGTAPFAAVAAGVEGTAQSPLTVAIADDAADGDVVTLRLAADRGAGGTDTSAWSFTVAASRLEPVALGAAAGFVQPGGTTDLRLTLRNDGSLAAAGGTVTLALLSPAGPTLGGATATFGACAPGASVTTDAGLSVTVGEALAVGTALNFAATITTTEGWRRETTCAVIVGDVDVTAPSGPDAHGYYAYDSADIDYPASRPTYAWTEISTLFGGSGTKLNFSVPDNLATSVQVNLPFTFRYFGQDYTRLRVCDNGWVSFDLGTDYDFYNWTLPSTHGNDALVAPFWDNLNPEMPGVGDELPNGIAPDGIYTWHDTATGRFIIEWSRQPNYQPEVLGLQTFQLVLMDPAVRVGPSGDGEMLFLYRHVANNDNLRMYATVGWESPDGLEGLQLSYDNVNIAGMAPLQSGLAVRVTTAPPVRVPFALSAFTAQRVPGAVRLDWRPADDRPVLGWHVDRSDASGTERLTVEPLPADAQVYLDTAPSGDAAASYTLTALHPWQAESRPGTATVAGAAVTRLWLQATGPNPSRDGAVLSYALPRAGAARLRVYDVAGRLVRTLTDASLPAGEGRAAWDGRDDAGRQLGGGLYFGRLETADGMVTTKLTLVR